MKEFENKELKYRIEMLISKYERRIEEKKEQRRMQENIVNVLTAQIDELQNVAFNLRAAIQGVKVYSRGSDETVVVEPVE